jgi:hypothetical protein
MLDKNNSKKTTAAAKAKLEAMQFAPQTLPTRFSRQAEALTAEHMTLESNIHALRISINTLYTQAQTVLTGTSPKEADTHQYTPKEVQRLENNFKSLNLRIEHKQEKDQQYLRIWKPIYNLFRKLFGQERKLTILTQQQNLAYSIFIKIEEAVTSKLNMEAKQVTLKEGLDYAVDKQNNLSNTLSPIQETLKEHQLGKTMRQFVSDNRKSVAFVAKALDRFLTEPTEEKRDVLFQTMKDNTAYIKGPEKFLKAIDNASELYEEVEKADKPAHASSSNLKKNLAQMKPDESNAPNQHKKK